MLKLLRNKAMYGIFLFVLSCKPEDKLEKYNSCPKNMRKTKLEQYYHIAALAMYEYNTWKDCGCYATYKRDTAALIQLDLELINFTHRNDTMTFWFHFVKRLDNKIDYYNVYNPIPVCFTGCTGNGVTFIGDTLQPKFMYSGEAIIPLENNPFISSSKQYFNQYLEKEPNISNNLKYLLSRRD